MEFAHISSFSQSPQEFKSHCLSPGPATRSLKLTPASELPHPLDSIKQCVTDYVQGNLRYFMFSIRNLTFSLDLVLFSPMKIIWGLGYHVVLMEERGQPKQETIFGCFVRVICMSTMGTVGSHSHVSGKASIRLSYHGRRPG